ncbi:hypothetical protein D3C76_1796310 [compost metagenome]
MYAHPISGCSVYSQETTSPYCEYGMMASQGFALEVITIPSSNLFFSIERYSISFSLLYFVGSTVIV